MKTILLASALILGLAVPLLAQESAGAGQLDDGPYDLLFRTGTLDGLPREDAIVYEKVVTNHFTPAAATQETGEVELTFEGGEPEMVQLRFLKDGRHRGIGEFPASVGNPIILYFMESVVRDMASSAGGSPFYIRNRVKAALLEPAAEEQGGADGQTVAVTLRPFEGDPNASRMQGFEHLALTVTMSEDVPGWYTSLAAVVPGEGGGEPVYSSTLTLEPGE